MFLVGAERPEEYDRGGLREALMLQYLVGPEKVTDPEAAPSLEKIAEVVKAEGEDAFRRKVEYLSDFGKAIGIPDVDSQVLSQVMLAVLDERWKDHLYDLDQLRNAIQYRAWGQKDPLVEYKREAFEMFVDLMRDIRASVMDRFFKFQVQLRPQPAAGGPAARPATATGPQPPASDTDLMLGARPALPIPTPSPVTTSGGGDGGAAPPPRQPRALPKVGRNDPCPCGSGRKYKKCHGAGA
jgi:preprotein translocase subunit SecA